MALYNITFQQAKSVPDLFHIGVKSVRNLVMRCIPAYPMGGRGGGGWSQNLRTYAQVFTDLHQVFLGNEPKLHREDLGLLDALERTEIACCCFIITKNFRLRRAPLNLSIPHVFVRWF